MKRMQDQRPASRRNTNPHEEFINALRELLGLKRLHLIHQRKREYRPDDGPLDRHDGWPLERDGGRRVRAARPEF